MVVSAYMGASGCTSRNPSDRAGPSRQALASAPPSVIGLTRPNDILSAVFYYPWWSASDDPPTCGPTVHDLWCCSWRKKQGDEPGGPGAPPPRPPRPVLGLYDSSDETVIGKHMDWLVEYGVDIVALQWGGIESERRNIDLVIKAIEARDLRFVLLYDMAIRLEIDHGTGTIDLDDKLKQGEDVGKTKGSRLVHDFREFSGIGGYFHHPKHLKLKNQPVVYLYVSRALVGKGSTIEAAFAEVHAAARDHFDGLYIVADHLAPQGTPYHTLKCIGPKAITAFHPIGLANVQPGPQQPPIQAWADLMARDIFKPAMRKLPELGRIDLMPGVFVQYDHDGIDGTQCALPPRSSQSHLLRDGQDWRYMLTTAGIPFARIAEERATSPRGRETVTRNADESILWIYSFNEWGEGAGLEPLQPRNPPYPYGFGFELLEILRQVMDAGWVDPPGIPCEDMGPGWYEADEGQACNDACDEAECVTKWVCNGEDCYSPRTGLNYCFKCPTTPVCGDMFCARGKGEHCYTCPQDCPCDGYTCAEMGLGWYYPDEGDRCRETCNEECQVKLDCKGKVCLAPHLQESKCLLCTNLGRCGDGACQPRHGESCQSCPGDCGPCVQPKTCGEMGPGWYEANEVDRCQTDCEGECLAKHDCGGVPCSSPTTGLGYCLKCPQLARCGDGACQGRIGENCQTCPGDCGGCGGGDEGGGDEGGGESETNSCASQGFLTQDECNQPGMDCSHCTGKRDCGGRPCEGGYCLKCD